MKIIITIIILIAGHDNDNWRRSLVKNNLLVTFADNFVCSGFDRFSYDNL